MVTRPTWFLPILGGVLLLLGVTQVMSQPQSVPQLRTQAQELLNQGNFKEAYDRFQKLCHSQENNSTELSQDLENAVRCLERLGRLAEVDALLEKTVAVHEKQWRVQQTAARIYLRLDHHGFLVAGNFERGPHRGGGKMVNSLERDRVRALQLMRQAMPLAQEDDNKQDVSEFFISLSDQLLYDRGFHEAWRLQYLTDLEKLPDYEDGYFSYREYVGAPTDAEGNPIYHTLPESWQAAETDGQRWRWALAQVVENVPSRKHDVQLRLGSFFRQQFGVESLQYSPVGRFFGLAIEEEKPADTGVYELHTLGDDETIAKLASGIKRFKLSDEFNFIRIYLDVADEARDSSRETALETLAEIFENRRQYPRAADFWKRLIRDHGAGQEQYRQLRLDQILGNWGRFEGVNVQPSARGASVDFRFRNAKKVSFSARPIDVAKVLADLKAYLRSSPAQLEWEKIDVNNLGFRIVHQNEGKYAGRPVANWEEELEPRKRHFDRRITVTTPLRKAGAYLLTAKVEGGNESKIVLWVADTAIVKKQLSGKTLYYIADAVTGAPINKANVEFLGFRVQQQGRTNRFRVETKNFALTSDADGQIIADANQLPNEFQWLVVTRSSAERLAFHGFHGVWTGKYHDHEYNQTKAFVITDRPVYRPDQKVHFKAWIRKAQYDQEIVSDFANREFPVEIYNPKGEKIFETKLKTDEFAGLEGEYSLPSDATLGRYQLVVPRVGGGSFRVEEYKKPEFEVSIEAPKEPVMLGEKVTARIQARYLFGAPVTEATVKYKVTRTGYSRDWFPVMPWDWCYGPGYWWFSYDYPWYPGWSRWAGCLRPSPWWWPRAHQPPELVAEVEVPVGQDGTVEVAIDTAVAKAVHSNSDHEYQITAEVRDASRRTIVGQGKVLVARQPFKVYTWVDRGHYRVGDTVHAHFLAQTLDQRPVPGSGKLKLLKVIYNDQGKPVETPVQEWELETNAEGLAQQSIRASAKGQYRLSFTMTDAHEHTQEGGYLFTVTGDGFDGSEYRFNSLELIPDQREYQPGNKIRLQINTDRPGSTVLLFVRAANGICLPPKTVRLEGKSTIEEIEVVKKDMPNFFIEAVTVADARVHAEMKEIVVPPEKRVLNLEVMPSAETYKPGQKATVKLRLTEFNGENFRGSTVVTVYDKAVEYIAGGTNVPDIKEFFWKWRRHHHPQHESSLERYSDNIGLPNKPDMANLGIFGEEVATDFDRSGAVLNKAMATRGEMRFGGGMGGMMGGGLGMARRGASLALADGAAPPGPAAPMAAAPMAAAEAAGADMLQDAGSAPGGTLVEPSVRSQFADTAFWAGTVNTDANGIAEISLDMPENLTTWKIRAWGMGHGTKVGSGESEVVTRKDLIVRLQAPRFFVQKDEVVLSANVHNYLAKEKDVTVVLELPDEQLEPIDPVRVQVKIPANGEHRVDWRVKVRDEGLATVRMKALTDEESDAMEMKLPCKVHGILKTESWAGTVRPDRDRASVKLRVPAERRKPQSVLEVRYSPTLAGAMVDALPYLADFPYGCTEQTLNRFLPSVITQQVLLEMQLNLADIRDKRTNLNAQEIGDDRERAQQWKRLDRNPVFDEDELRRMVKQGVDDLTNMQLSDGGWGWFSGWGEHSYPHTTAVVVHGLQIAQKNDVPIVPDVIQRGVEWLKRQQAEQVRLIKNAPSKTKPWKDKADNLDAFVYMVLVDAGHDDQAMREFLYRDRVELAVYAKAMFGLALHTVGDQAKRDMLVQNIRQFLVEDQENETAFLRLPENNYWWFWYGSEIEANAYFLKLLTRVDPQGETAPRLVKYLLNNRKHGTYWNSTRDTAICVEAFADFLRATQEIKPEMTVEIWLDGEKRQEVSINADNLFSFDNKFVLIGDDVKDGEHELEIRRRGKGSVYFNAYLTNFTLEDPIAAAGLEVRIERKYYKLIPEKKSIKVSGARGQVVDQRVEKYTRQPLENLATLKSGDLVEIELEIASKNDYEYMMFEDLKAAGFEPVDVRSGYGGEGLSAYMELRDDRVSFFVRQLARGKHSVSYRMRAEIPGRFSALPTQASAMYAPELRGNSSEIKLNIED